MKRKVMKMKRSMGAALVLGLVSLSACSAGSDIEAGDGDAGLGEDDGDPTAGDGDDHDPATGDEPALSEARATCSDSKSGPPLLARLTQAQVEATLREVFHLDDDWTVKLSPDPSSSLGFTNDASVLVVGGNTAKEMLRTAEDVADLVVAKLDAALPCSVATPDRACVEHFVATQGLRLFRRPLSSEDIVRYADFQASVEARSDFSTGMKWMITSMIQSPHAFYRSELGTERAGGHYALDDYEMASELSYMLIGTAPDQALLDQAAAGALQNPAVRRAEAQRLLSSHPRAKEGLRTFFNEWLRYRSVLGASRVDDPRFSAEISPLLVQETREFLDHMVFAKNGTLRDLMTADYTMLSRELSDFYGYGGASTEQFTEVTRPANYGRGILAQGSLLASRAHQAASSPTLRGLLFTERFLCMEKPPVPNVVPTIESTQTKAVNTTREKYELNHGQGRCGQCHRAFEPYGYVFEHFDETGRYRETEDGHPINTVVTDAPLPDGTGIPLSDFEELVAIVDSRSEVQHCVSGLIAAYLFSGAGGTNCLAEEARARAANGELSIIELILALTETPHFSTRKVP